MVRMISPRFGTTVWTVSGAAVFGGASEAEGPQPQSAASPQRAVKSMVQRQRELVVSSDLEGWPVRSPSPRPSPQGRGRIIGRASAHLARLVFGKDGMRASLSLGERGGVRGNRTSVQLRLPTCSYFLA